MLLASLCVDGHSIPTFRFSWLRTKKCILQGSYAGKKRGEVSIYFALFIKCEVWERAAKWPSRAEKRVLLLRPYNLVPVLVGCQISLMGLDKA